jgi:hypothetical protein
MEVRINTLHIGNGDLLANHHLVERDNEESIQEAAMENGQSNHAADESEVVQMFRIDTRVRIDLQCIIVVS